MSDQKIDFIRKYKIKEPEIDYGDGVASYVQKIAAHYVEEMDEFLADSIIKALPEDISELYLINKKEVLKVILRDVAKKPRIKLYPNNVIAFHCGQCDEHIMRMQEGDYWTKKPTFCSDCGTRMDWSVEE